MVYIHLYWIVVTEMIESFLIRPKKFKYRLPIEMKEDRQKIFRFYSNSYKISWIRWFRPKWKKKKKGEGHHPEILILKKSSKKGGYGEIGRRYGLNWLEP